MEADEQGNIYVQPNTNLTLNIAPAEGCEIKSLTLNGSTDIPLSDDGPTPASQGV